jgi:glucosamine--fructose-6-phosphate aminotransferase (isomerizing)
MEEAWIGQCRDLAEAALPSLLEAEVRFVVARGYRFASALETALKLVECPLLMAKGYSVADFLHGPLALAGKGAWIASYGEEVPGDAWVCQGPDCGDRPDSPVLDIVFGQWLALLAARARSVDPDRPPRIAKVTRSL